MPDRTLPGLDIAAKRITLTLMDDASPDNSESGTYTSR